MSLQTRLNDLITAMGTDYKFLRSMITGSNTGTLASLTTTDKASIIAAINEVKASSGTPSDASETAKGIIEIATQAETNTGTDDVRAITPLKMATRLAAAYQPLDSDLTSVAALTTTSYGRAFLELANQAGLVALLPSYQPLDGDLTSIAGLTTTSYGRAFLELANQAALLALLPTDFSRTTLSAAGLTGATQASRYVGATTSGAPASGTFVIGDFVISRDGGIWICTTGGSPGTWVRADSAAYQPLDSDLTSIAAVATTSYGRAFLALADQTALMALVQAASATVQGKVELATDAETITGTDTARATTPANLAALFTDRIDTNTALGSSNTKVPSQLAVKTYVDALADAVNVMQFKGNLDASANPNYPAASSGHTYRISVAGKIGGASGPNVEVGDLIIALADGLSAGNHATVGTSWSIQQANIDGAVTGPASATSGNLPTFNGTSGKILQDSGVSIDSDGTMAANSSTRVPTQSAVRTYIGTTNYTKSELGDPETDLAALYATAKT